MPEKRDVLESLVRRYGRQISVNGQLCLSSNGDPTWAAAFEALGWDDPYVLPDEPPVEPTPLPAGVDVAAGVVVAAVVVSPETAVLPDAEGHTA